MTTPAAIPARRADLLSATFGDGLVLVDRFAARAHILNSSAAWVWDRLDGIVGVDDLVAAVRASNDVDPATLEADIEMVIGYFLSAGILVDDANDPTRPPAEDAIDLDAPQVGAAVGLASRDLAAVGSFRSIDWSFAVETDDPLIGAQVADLLAPLRTPDPASIPATDVYGVRRNSSDAARRYDLLLGATTLGHAESRAEAVDLLLNDANMRAIQRSTRHLVFHAGAVVIDGEAVLLPAVSGSGKSTLTASLVAAGHPYLTDEAAVLDPATFAVEPYPKPLSLSDRSLAALGLALGERASRRKGHVPIRQLGSVATAAVPVGRLVFPTYGADLPTALTPLAPDEVLTALVPCAFAPTWGVEGALDRVIALIESVPAFRLTFSDLPEAERLIAGRVRSGPSGRQVHGLGIADGV